MGRILGYGHVKGIRRTNYDDVIHGSRSDDRFILRQGDDIVSGGAGNDTVRYDRSGVGAVTVNLTTGTATGTWKGQAFTDKRKNIENIRGSRADGDTPIGNAKDNYFDGKGGNDTLQGKARNNTLRGDTGSDKFIFKSGDGFDALDTAEKISLKGVAEIVNLSDLMANNVMTSGASVIIDDGPG
jgi:Ca2+-binding RTX toxin-like protein